MKSFYYKNTKYSLFSHYPRDFSPGKIFSLKIPLVTYCKLKKISRKQAKRLIALKLLNITRFKRRIWVEECDPEQINDVLGILS